MFFMRVINDPILRLLWPPWASVATSQFLALRLSSLTFWSCIFHVYQDIIKIPTPFSSQLQGLQFWFNNFFDLRPFKFRLFGLKFLTSIISKHVYFDFNHTSTKESPRYVKKGVKGNSLLICLWRAPFSWLTEAGWGCVEAGPISPVIMVRF